MNASESDEVGPDAVIGQRADWSGAVKKLMGLFDTPAYLRRAQRVQAARQQLFRRCETQREEWLGGVRFRARQWNAVAGREPAAVRGRQDRQVEELNRLLGTTGATLADWARTGRASAVRRDLAESVRRFNARWTSFVETVDVAAVNELIDGYNRYYVFEKECALRSARIAARGFEPLEPITVESLLRTYPLLPAPAD